MQTFLGVVGMQPFIWFRQHLKTRGREDVFPGELVHYLSNLIFNNITPRDIVNRESIRNAMIVAMAVGGSTNVMLHAPEIARAAGYRVL